VLAFHESATLYSGEIPVPLTDSPTDESEALLLTVRDPEAAPAFVGEKTTLASTLCPDGIVNGKEIPESENSELLLDAEDTVTLPPVAVRVEVCALLLPRSILPKLSEDGLMLSFPVLVDVPVPMSGIFNPTPRTNTLPPVGPTVPGLKTRFSVTLFFGVSSTGNVGVVTENPLPSTARAKMVSAQPLQLITTGNEAVAPTATSPKDRAAGDALTTCFGAPTPLTGNESRELDKLLVKITAAWVYPSSVGTKLTWTVTLSPGANTAGNWIPDTLNSESLRLIAEIVAL
jgi:hypothetical protein